MSEPILCPRCGGTEIDCPVCGLPPKRAKPYDRRADNRGGLTYVSFVAALQAQLLWAVQGIDISSWNGTMHFDVTKRNAQYAYVRIGYNSHFKDYRADFNRAGLIAADIPYGVYWYLRPGIDDPNEVAESIAAVAAGYPFDLEILLDIEQTAYSERLSTHVWLVTCSTRLNQLLPKVQAIYSSAGFWNDHMPLDSVHWRDYRKHVANWTDGNAPWLPTGWANWQHWQWSADGNRKGIEYGSSPDGDADMDLNRFNGTVEQFNLVYGTHIKPIGEGEPPPPPPEGLPDFAGQLYKVITTTEGLRLRDYPSLSGKILAGLPFGYQMKSVGAIDDNWAAVLMYCSRKYLKEL